MRRFMSESKTIKTICCMLILAMVANFAPMAIPSAQAQIVPSYALAVLDFANESGVQGELPARLATDATVVELGKTNRYDVGITRSQIKAEMDRMDLKAPLNRADIIRLGQELSVDAVLEGSIRSIELSGSGSSRAAKVTLIMQLIDQASGESINGAIQSGTSFSRVGFTPDDQSLISEAINQAAFLAVKQMTDYVIPEATIHMSVGSKGVILNKGIRDNIKPGMRMIVSRQKEIVGYILVTGAGPIDADAEITRQLRGIRPEDKVKAIYELPIASKVIQTKNTLPSAAPTRGKSGLAGFSKIGKYFVIALVVAGVLNAYNSGRGNEPGQSISTRDSNTKITWDPTKYNHGLNVIEYQILRDGLEVVKVISDPTAIDLGYTDIRSLYGTGVEIPVTYNTVSPTDPATLVVVPGIVAPEAFGIQHTYSIRVLYAILNTDGTPSQYQFSKLSNMVRATAIEPVRIVDIINPPFDPTSTPPEISISDLQEGLTNFQWNNKEGANEYYVTFQAVQAGVTGVFDTKSIGIISEQGPIVELTPSMRNALADFLTRSNLTSDVVMKWQVFSRNSTDSNKQAWTAGEVGRFVVSDAPPPAP